MMTVHNPGDECSLDEIFENIRKLLEKRSLGLVENRGLDEWYRILGDRIQKKLGRTKVG